MNCENCDYRKKCEIYSFVPWCEDCKYNNEEGFEYCTGCTAITVSNKCNFEKKEVK